MRKSYPKQEPIQGPKAELPHMLTLTLIDAFCLRIASIHVPQFSKFLRVHPTAKFPEIAQAHVPTNTRLEHIIAFVCQVGL